MPPEERHLVYDEMLLWTASVNATRVIVRRNLELIEQSWIMLRELNVREADGRLIS